MPFRTEGGGNMTLLKETHSKYWAHLKRQKEKETIYSANT